MAIRPVDLQLAYMAAPQNAAVLSTAQEGPQAAQQAAQAAFVAELARREESVDQPAGVKGAKVQSRKEGEPGGQQGSPDGHGRRASEEPAESAESPGSAGKGEHIIDVMA